MGFYNTFGRHYSANRGTGYSSAPKIMQAKYAGRCLDCGGAIAVGDTIRYSSGQVRHGSQDVCRQADAQRAALAATICSNGAEANRFAASAGSAFRGAGALMTAVENRPGYVPAVGTPKTAVAIDLTPLRAFIQAAKDR
jgi:hypothetical protein